MKKTISMSMFGENTLNFKGEMSYVKIGGGGGYTVRVKITVSIHLTNHLWFFLVLLLLSFLL
ncbi:MAG: hypothetical protein LBQ66_10840 [Planctomycetaceae bacterium]|jgi:hypothetical protein|nr:hypothetical protein [Planctomycetaceae bacterium]